MEGDVFLRYWLPMTSGGPEDYSPIGDLGFAYFETFRQIVGKELRVLSSQWVQQAARAGSVGEPIFGVRYVGRWMKFSAYATTMVPRSYINIVLGGPTIYETKHRQAYGVKNIAIVFDVKPDVIPTVQKYNQVWAFSEPDRDTLAAAGVKSDVVRPEQVDEIRERLDAEARE